jgi:hypothetical protein
MHWQDNERNGIKVKEKSSNPLKVHRNYGRNLDISRYHIRPKKNRAVNGSALKEVSFFIQASPYKAVGVPAFF